MITLSPGSTTLQTLENIYRGTEDFKLTPVAFEQVARSAAILAERIKGTDAIYGVNTGFGKLASVRIDSTDLAALQRNLVRSHCAGVGAPLSLSVVRLIMALKCLSLGRGASGVRPVVIEQIQNMVQADILPVIPAKGSVGASGDLAPLAHMAAAMIGEGEVFYKDRFGGAGRCHRRAGPFYDLSCRICFGATPQCGRARKWQRPGL